jgi:hypothetical protein
MNVRRMAELVGGVAVGAAAVGTELAKAQEDLGDSIANSVANSVSSVATNSGGTATGGTSVEHSEVELGDHEGLAVADASGGNNNLSFVS